MSNKKSKKDYEIELTDHAVKNDSIPTVTYKNNSGQKQEFQLGNKNYIVLNGEEVTFPNIYEEVFNDTVVGIWTKL
jgi:hypothetical protein